MSEITTSPSFDDGKNKMECKKRIYVPLKINLKRFENSYMDSLCNKGLITEHECTNLKNKITHSKCILINAQDGTRILG